MTNQAFSYYGATRGELVLALVFDRKEALRTVLGPSPPSHFQGTRVLMYKNVVVFYTSIGRVPNPTEKILKSLRRVL
jgi:hypothetical protein